MDPSFASLSEFWADLGSAYGSSVHDLGQPQAYGFLSPGLVLSSWVSDVLSVLWDLLLAFAYPSFKNSVVGSSD